MIMRGTRQAGPVASLLVVTALCVGAPRPARAEAACGDHAYLADCREKVAQLLTPAERARLSEIPLAGAGAPAAPLRRLAADRVVRRLAPLVAEAQGRGADASRLRALAPLTSRSRARAAARALREPIAAPPAPPAPDGGAAAHPLGGCEQPLVHAALDAAEIEASGGQRLESACRAPSVACGALRAGVERARVVDELVGLLRDLAAEGRRLGPRRCRR